MTDCAMRADRGMGTRVNVAMAGTRGIGTQVRGVTATETQDTETQDTETRVSVATAIEIQVTATPAREASATGTRGRENPRAVRSRLGATGIRMPVIEDLREMAAVAATSREIVIGKAKAVAVMAVVVAVAATAATLAAVTAETRVAAVAVTTAMRATRSNATGVAIVVLIKTDATTDPPGSAAHRVTTDPGRMLRVADSMVPAIRVHAIRATATDPTIARMEAGAVIRRQRIARTAVVATSQTAIVRQTSVASVASLCPLHAMSAPQIVKGCRTTPTQAGPKNHE